MNVTTGKRETRSTVSVGVYSVLFLLGLVEGMIGSFQYARTAGSVPVAALVCCAVILATCLLGAWAMHSATGTDPAVRAYWKLPIVPSTRPSRNSTP